MVHSRRAFFCCLPAAALPASWTALAQALAGAPAPPGDAYWGLIRRQFPLEDGLIYLNAANVCPASRPVLDRHWEYLRDFHANPSFQNRDKYVALQERARAKLAALVGATADEIAITRNTSEGNNLVVHGIDLKRGDEVLIASHNHPSNGVSWKVRARRDGFEVRTLATPVPAASRDELLGAVERAITPRTRVIALTHVTNTAGLLHPVREIARLAQPRGIWLHVDGAQTFGALAVNLAELGCDSYTASAHKWMMGPLEAGLLFVRSGRIAELWPSIVTAGWSDTLKGARKFEVLGQRDDPRVVAFEAAVDFLDLVGLRHVEARVRELAGYLKNELAQIPNLELRTNREPELSAGVVKVRLAKTDLRRAYDTLWSRHRIAIAMTPSGDAEGLRFCPHIYNSVAELDRVVAALRELAA